MRLIDADALKEDINNAFLRCLDMQYVKDIIDNAPTVERPTGHWISISGTNISKCSECQVRQILYDMQGNDFCPSCGADMRGGRE